MASSKEFVDYACQQMGQGVSYRKMFGDYALYCDGKCFGLICDNQVFIKPTSAAEQFVPQASLEAPYPGAKPHVLLEELEDRDFLAALIAASCAQLPLPKPKKKKESRG